MKTTSSDIKWFERIGILAKFINFIVSNFFCTLKKWENLTSKGKFTLRNEEKSSEGLLSLPGYYFDWSVKSLKLHKMS